LDADILVRASDETAIESLLQQAGCQKQGPLNDVADLKSYATQHRSQDTDDLESLIRLGKLEFNADR